jgi:hypothetical protein
MSPHHQPSTHPWDDDPLLERRLTHALVLMWEGYVGMVGAWTAYGCQPTSFEDYIDWQVESDCLRPEVADGLRNPASRELLPPRTSFKGLLRPPQG